jgi:hypothetical protein
MSLKNDLAVWLSIVTLSCGLSDRGAAEPMNWPCAGRCFDAAWIANRGWAYFVKGHQFWRYDIVANRVDHGHMGDAILKVQDSVFPRPMRWPGLPQSWSTGINAALNGGDGKVYLFKGRDYVRLDIATAKIDAGPLPIANQWPGLPAAWTAGFDVAVNWGNGKLIFIKGREALGYDLATGKAGAPRPLGEILRGLPEAWSGVIDTAVNWGNGKAYIFKGNQYVRYDIAGDKVDDIPQPVARNWPGLMRLIDWSYGPLDKVPERLKAPDHVISTGQDATGRPLTLCAAKVGDAIYPGKIAGNGRGCIYADGQRELGADVFAVAATHLRLEWTGKTTAPDRLVPVGNAPNRRPYYLCRGRFADAIHPGRIEDLSGGCTITHEGRSHVLKDNFEVAVAPTPVNFPHLPHLVRLLSPLPGSERFKEVCYAEINPAFRGRARLGQYPRDLPDLKTTFQTIGRNVCLILYKSPREVPKYTRKLELIIMDPPGGETGLGDVNTRDGHCIMRFDPRWLFPAESVSLPDAVMVFYHETAHCAQYGNGVGGLARAFLEAHADHVRWVKVWGNRVTSSGGALKDGYEVVAYFMEWLDRRHPEFVYKYNMALSGSSKSADEIIRQLTGKPMDALWREYQSFVAATLGWPESQLRWPPPTADGARHPASPATAPATAPSANGIRVVSGTYGGNCKARLTGGTGGTTNKTAHLKAECEGKDACEYDIFFELIGDPAPGCSKDYVAVWQCPGGSGGIARAEAEAGMGSKVVLSCKRANGAGPPGGTAMAPATMPPAKGIRVVSGTYGGNCKARLTGGAGGKPDKTAHLKAECEGKDVCEYSVRHDLIGDPAAGCSKDYVAVWQCPGGGRGGTARAEPEAGLGSKVVLSCDR